MLAIVLHAHLPFVRHPEYEYALEENWLCQAITESYVPLLLMMDGLIADGVDFRLTFSLTPPLVSMFGDELLRKRYLARLEKLIELAKKELARTDGPLARMYHALFLRIHAAYTERYRCDLAAAFARLQELGKIEIIGSCATHGYLPLLSLRESAARMQIAVGVEHYQRVFGRAPRGFWLPECGYYAGVDRVLRKHGVRFAIVETHAVPRTPMRTKAGLAVFARHAESSRQVWSSFLGYPGDFDYREFYRDIGYDLDLDYIGPYIHPDGIRVDTGLKYWRITGKDGPKEPYVPARAEAKAELHAEHFLRDCVGRAAAGDGIVVAPFDAELFGHWWFEGPRWLDFVIRKAARHAIRLTTLSEYLELHPPEEVAEPLTSSWGRNGFHEVWLNPKNDWIYPLLDGAACKLEGLKARTPLARRARDQAARELLLAQASDWAFMIAHGTTAEYAANRVKTHLQRFEQMCERPVDEKALAELEERDCIFPHGGWALARAGLQPRRAASETKISRGLKPAFRVAMLFPETVAQIVENISRDLERMGHRVTLNPTAAALRADPPDILHAHDWNAAGIMAELKSRGARTVLTIHDAAGAHRDALMAADAITAPRARELQIDGRGFGLEAVYRRRAARLVGIRNRAGSYAALYRQLMSER